MNRRKRDADTEHDCDNKRPFHSILQLTLALIGKFGAAACFTIVFVYTAEMFPTEIRSTAIGCSSLCGRIGGMLAPQVIRSHVYTMN